MASSSQILRGVTWSREETDILLSMWAKPGIQDQIESNARDHTVFEFMAAELSKSGYQRTWIQVRVKLKNLTQWYKTMRQKRLAGNTQMNKPQLRLYKRLDPILQSKPLPWADRRPQTHTSNFNSFSDENIRSRTTIASDDDTSYGATNEQSSLVQNLGSPPNVSLPKRFNGDEASVSKSKNGSTMELSRETSQSDNLYRGLVDNEHVPFIKRFMARLEAEGPKDDDTVSKEQQSIVKQPKATGAIIIKEETASEPETDDLGSYSVPSDFNEQSDHSQGYLANEQHSMPIALHSSDNAFLLSTVTHAPNFPNHISPARYPSSTVPHRHPVDPTRGILLGDQDRRWFMDKHAVPLGTKRSCTEVTGRPNQERSQPNPPLGQPSPLQGRTISASDEKLVDKLVEKITEHTQKMHEKVIESFNMYQQKFQETFLLFEEKRLKMQLDWEQKQKREERDHQLRMLQTLAQMFNTNGSNESRFQNTE